MDDVFTVMRALGECASDAAAAPLVQAFREHVQRNPEEVRVRVRAMALSQALRQIKLMHGDFDEKFLEVDALCYAQGDGGQGVAVFVAALQDYVSHRDDFDGEILRALVSSVEKLHLQGVVNDISVNHLQWHAGSPAER